MITIKELRPQEEEETIKVRICFLLPKTVNDKIEAIKEDYMNSYNKEVTRTSIINTMINDYINKVEEDPTLIKEGVF
jgi:hypothetical protein